MSYMWDEINSEPEVIRKCMKKKEEMQNSELLDAFSRSGRSYDEILTFLDVK